MKHFTIICAECGKEYTYTARWKTRRKYCIECEDSWRARYYETHREKCLEAAKKYYAEHKDEINAKQREYYRKKKEMQKNENRQA